MLTFNAIDLETANRDRSSICQIGIVHVGNGEFTERWQTLVDPEVSFEHRNMQIHGISESDIKGSPTLPEVHDELRRRLNGSVLVSHMPFDRTALGQAMERYGLEQLHVTWLDSARIARLAWPEKYRDRGYALKNIAQDLNISFRHHDALQDAEAAAKVVLHACVESNTDIEGWLELCDSRSTSRVAKSATSLRQSFRPTQPNADGPLFGETVAFTGTLSISRKEAAEWAAEAGCKVVKTVTRQVTILVVGTQDQNRLKGYTKSNSHRKAEQMIAAGREIQIHSESEFFELMGVDIWCED